MNDSQKYLSPISMLQNSESQFLIHLYSIWEYICIQYGNTFVFNMGIHLYSIWEYICIQYGNISVFNMGIHLYSIWEYICIQYGNNYCCFAISTFYNQNLLVSSTNIFNSLNHFFPMTTDCQLSILR